MNRTAKKIFDQQSTANWLVFVFDLVVCLVALLLANLLHINLSIRYFTEDRTGLFYQMAAVIFVSSICLYAAGTYRSILRFSGLKAAMRTVVAIAFSVFILWVIHTITTSLGKAFLLTPILFTYFFIAVFLLVGYRLLTKNLYQQSKAAESSIHILIYGSGFLATQLKNTIEQAANGSYKVVGFIDEEISNIGKTIDTVPVFTPEQIEQVSKSWQVEMLLFSRQEMDWAKKNQLVEYCLANDIKIKNIPPVNEWIHGQLSLAQLKEIRIEELLDRPLIDLKHTTVESFLTNKRIVITGAAGSIGSEIARQVAAINPMLLILCDQNETGLHDLEYELKNSYPQCPAPVIHICDIRDSNAVENLFRRFKPGIVFHAAAYKHVPIMESHPSEAIRNNVLGTKVLADLSIKYGVDRFLLISTDKAINPTNIMGASKRLAEIYVQSLGNRNRKVVHVANQPADNANNKVQISAAGATKFITTRFGNVLGSNGSVIARFKEQIASGGPVTVTDPEIIRYFMTISEACSLVLEAATMGKGSEIFIFDMGEPVKILDLARKMIRLSGLTPGKDIQIKFTGLRPGEKLFEELLNKKEQVIPTHHKKILIANVMEYDFYEINRQLDDLIEMANLSQDEEVVRRMKRILPEFVSKNSSYTSFDEINPNDIATAH